MNGERVYEALAARPGEFLSGEELSRELGVSRAAVWKAVEALRAQGCTVEARTGLGYRLVELADRLGRREVAACFTAPRENWRVLAEVDSTNNECRRLAIAGAKHGTVVMADCQSAGRGRRGRAFHSPPGQGLYLSILWRPDCPPEKLLPLTALSAVAVCRAIERLAGLEQNDDLAPRIKWPNDLVLQNKKVSGILTELSVEAETGLTDYVIVGIGINCRQRAEDFPPELREAAISLDMALPVTVRRPALAAALTEELDTMWREAPLRPDRWLEAYRSRCMQILHPVEVVRDGQRVQAVVLAVDERFGLVVRYDDGTVEALRSGEVTVRGLYGYV